MVAVTALAVVITAGCARYTGTSAARAGRTAGEYVDDKAITARVGERLQQDPSVSALPIEVQTFQNDVQLTGFVEFPEQSRRAEEIARSVPNVQTVRNNIVVKDKMGWDERLRQPQAADQARTGAQQQPQRQQTFSGEITSLDRDGQAVLKVRTEQGELPVMASQWDDKKGELNLRTGDNVQITGYLSGFGAQRHIVAEEISANGKSVRFESGQPPYRETGQEQQPER
jgi:hypothetical protein